MVLSVTFGGVANLTATGHDEPSLLCAGEVRFSQPIPHNVRNAPCVSGRDNNKTLIGCDWRSIARLDAVIHAKKLVAQGDRDTLCDVPAVPGAAEIQNHIKMPSQWSISFLYTTDASLPIISDRCFMDIDPLYAPIAMYFDASSFDGNK